MCPMYTVKQGDYLVKIAKAHGLADWRRIYDDPQNADFRRQRPNPNLIHPGDRIFIPEKAPREETCETEKKHTFIVQIPRAAYHLVIRDLGGEPLALAKYELKTNRKTYTCSLQDADEENQRNLQAGIVHEVVKVDEEEGQLKVWIDDGDEDPDMDLKIKLGHLDPADEVTGVQARLNHLGYACGKVDGRKGPKTEDAIKAFQEEYGFEADGEITGDVRRKLLELHGC